MQPDTRVRRIRSYVLRSGRLTTAQRRALDELWQTYGLTLPLPLPLAKSLDTRHGQQQVFGRAAPLHLEIGFGDGRALLHMAEQNPHCNFIGAEVHRPGVGRLLLQLEARQLTNVKVFCDDGLAVLSLGVAPRSLQAIYLYFPDPWAKKKHHKRRIVQPAFVELVASRLVGGGAFHFATDWQPYAEQALQCLEQSGQFENCAGANRFAPRRPARPVTKFERRGRHLGNPVWDMVMRRIGA